MSRQLLRRRRFVLQLCFVLLLQRDSRLRPVPAPVNPGDMQGSPWFQHDSARPGYVATSVPYYNLAQGYSKSTAPRGRRCIRVSTVRSNSVVGRPAVPFSTPASTLDAAVTHPTPAEPLLQELRAPDEQDVAAPGTRLINPQFWDQNGVGCAGDFNWSRQRRPALESSTKGSGQRGHRADLGPLRPFLDRGSSQPLLPLPAAGARAPHRRASREHGRREQPGDQTSNSRRTRRGRSTTTCISIPTAAMATRTTSHS